LHRLTKQGGSIKTWKKRYCILRGTQLFYFKQPGETEAKGAVELSGQCIRHLTPKEADELELKHGNVILKCKKICNIHLAIKVFNYQQQSRTWILSNDSFQEILEWTVVLRKAALTFTGKTLTVDCNATTKSKKENNVYSSINDAVQKAKEFDKIVIQQGVYNEALYIRKPVLIEGVGDVKIENRGSYVITTTIN
jgi:hypothetical protein